MTHVVGALVAGIGATLVVGALPWGHRPRLVDRVGRHLLTPDRQDHVGPWASLVATLAVRLDQPAARLTARTEPLDVRLRRAGHHLDADGFRRRQLGQAVLALGLAALTVASGRWPLPTGALLAVVLAAPVAVVAGHDQVLARADRRRRDLVEQELPVIAEQLAVRLDAGRSLAVALAETAAHGRGEVAADLRRLTARLDRGAPLDEALRSWTEDAGAQGVRRLVGVLLLADGTPDLAALVDQESQALRDDAHRELLARLERRAQQVWVPVTVATLLPGSLLLLVPFLDALRLLAEA